MSAHIVEEPIICSPYKEPTRHWKIHEHAPPEKILERRVPTYMYLRPGTETDEQEERNTGYEIRLDLVIQIRKQLAEWRPLALRGEGGVSRVTMELLNHWRREGREQPLFFAQLEAAEAIIFLTEARPDFLQGINLPLDQPGEESQREGYTAFERRCCRMATGTGKTTVMGMLAAWSILNKVNNKNDRRFSDAILIVCPNVTIRDRLAELNPRAGDASLYQTRDLVPSPMMPDLAKGRILTTNWHIFEPRSNQAGNKVVKAGRRLTVRETVHIGPKATVARGRRYLPESELRRQHALGLLKILDEVKDRGGNLKKAEIESEKYIETDSALVKRVLNQELGTRGNILVFNDEAHHAYRLKSPEENEADNDTEIDSEIGDYYYREATTWVNGLDKIQKQRGINFCVDLSATPYFLGRAGQDTNRIFPWTVSSFDLQDSIESGLVKVPLLAARDSSGQDVPGYFNIWRWIQPKLTSRERGTTKTGPKAVAILKYAQTPVTMMASMWQETFATSQSSDDPRPPVLIIVCNTKKLADVMYEWLASDQPPTSTIPPASLPELVNEAGAQNTIRVYSDMQADLDSGTAKNDEDRWMRYTLDTVGKLHWPFDRQKRPQYPAGFEELAEKLNRPKHPPGRDVRCIVSVGMLTEGWDCRTVTHIIGLRPFMSQLLCEQVIGRGLRRASYEVDDNGFMAEETATVLGVPLSAFPVKIANGKKPKKKTRYRISALSQRKHLSIHFPNVEGYLQAIKVRLTCDMDSVPSLRVDPARIPPDVEVKAALATNHGVPSISGPGRASKVDLENFRKQFRLQEKIYEVTLQLTRQRAEKANCEIPANIVFQQLLPIVSMYFDQKVSVVPPNDIKDAFLAPYYGWIIDTLSHYIKPDEAAGESPELPRYDRMRPTGSTEDVDFYTRIKPYDVIKSHVNAVVPHSGFEKKAAYYLDQHPKVFSFVKNEGLNFTIPYLHESQMRDYEPDFLVRLEHGGETEQTLILEIKGFNDPAEEAKAAAARRWVAAVNADGQHGRWQYDIVHEIENINSAIDRACANIA